MKLYNANSVQNWISIRVLSCRLADGARLNLQKRAALMSPAAVFRRTPKHTPSLNTPLLGRHGLGTIPAVHRLNSAMTTQRKLSHDTQVQIYFEPCDQLTLSLFSVYIRLAASRAFSIQYCASGNSKTFFVPRVFLTSC